MALARTFYLFAVRLQDIKFIVPAPVFNKLCVRALLDYFSVGQHYYIIGAAYRRKPMRDDEHCAYILHLFQRVLN